VVAVGRATRQRGGVRVNSMSLVDTAPMRRSLKIPTSTWLRRHPAPDAFENASLALEHGKPVLVEKAFTMNGAQARELVALARARNLFMMEAMWTRSAPRSSSSRPHRPWCAGELVMVEADHGKWFEPDPTLGSSLPS